MRVRFGVSLRNDQSAIVGVEHFDVAAADPGKRPGWQGDVFFSLLFPTGTPLSAIRTRALTLANVDPVLVQPRFLVDGTGLGEAFHQLATADRKSGRWPMIVPVRLRAVTGLRVPGAGEVSRHSLLSAIVEAYEKNSLAFDDGGLVEPIVKSLESFTPDPTDGRLDYVDSPNAAVITALGLALTDRIGSVPSRYVQRDGTIAVMRALSGDPY